MANTSTIVTVNAEVSAAPAPSLLQQSGALISLGGSTLTTGKYQFCSTLAAVEAIIGTEGNYLELGDMATTFFAQPLAASVGVYVLELGVQGSVEAGITDLQSWITANPGVFYAYLCPASWDSQGAALNTMAANYSGPTGRTYFFVTTTSGTMSNYATTTKAIVAFVPAPTASSSEFGAAAIFCQWLGNNPTAANPAAPMAFRFLYGVTPWVLNGNTTTINAILAANVNLILTGAEGGISTACLFKGTTMDGTQMMAWYAVDYVQIQAKQSLAAAVINGSNSNPPLYYNQVGINQLLTVAETVGSTAISAGLLLTAVFAAVSFATYTAANSSAYAAGSYGGFSATVTTQNGFLSITFNLDAVQI